MSVTISKRVPVPVAPFRLDLVIITVVYNPGESRLSVNLNNIGHEDAVTLLNRSELLLSGYLGSDTVVGGDECVRSNNNNPVVEVGS